MAWLKPRWYFPLLSNLLPGGGPGSRTSQVTEVPFPTPTMFVDCVIHRVIAMSKANNKKATRRSPQPEDDEAGPDNDDDIKIKKRRRPQNVPKNAEPSLGRGGENGNKNKRGGKKRRLGAPPTTCPFALAINPRQPRLCCALLPTEAAAACCSLLARLVGCAQG